MTEKEKGGSGGKTRREFLKDAGLLVGGTAIGSTVLLAACSGGDGETVTKTVTQGGQTVTVGGQTVTVGAGATVTATQTESKFVCPSCNQEFDTLAAMKSHFVSDHEGEDLIPGLITLTINDKGYLVQVKSHWTLAFVIREKLGFIGTKRGCDQGQCGVCTLIIDGRAILSCMVLAVEAEGKSIETIEGVANDGELLPIQQAFIDYDALQCGFCTPGQIMSAKALLDANPNPTADEIKEAHAGNLCRCGSYRNILAAVLAVAG